MRYGLIIPSFFLTCKYYRVVKLYSKHRCSLSRLTRPCIDDQESSHVVKFKTCSLR